MKKIRGLGFLANVVLAVMLLPASVNAQYVNLYFERQNSGNPCEVSGVTIFCSPAGGSGSGATIPDDADDTWTEYVDVVSALGTYGWAYAEAGAVAFATIGSGNSGQGV